MAAVIEKLAEDFRANYPTVAHLLEDAAAVARGLGVPEQFGDIPLRGKLPQVRGAQRGETILTPLSPETQKLIERMRRDGYAVYETTGRTPASLRADGMLYWYLDPELEGVTAEPALLAFKHDPAKIFLPGSHNIPHDEQVELLLAEQVRVNGAYPGAGLIVCEGKLPEWMELALRHFKATNIRIFGKGVNNYSSTWTDTYRSEQPGADRAHFGHWSEAGGANAHLWEPDGVSPLLGLAALVKIPRK